MARRQLRRTMLAWGVKWVSDCRLDGRTEYVIGAGAIPPQLFKTRSAARAFIDEKYSYIKDRSDLKAEPHGWKMPSAVRVKVSVAVA